MIESFQSIKEIFVYVDGASRGNPGPAGAGVWIIDADGHCLSKRAEFLGVTTNNVAEYQALLVGLKEAIKLSPARLSVYMDSELVVKQVRGEYRVRSKDLLPLYTQVKKIMQRFSSVSLQYIPRKKNREADRLANHAIDKNE